MMTRLTLLAGGLLALLPTLALAQSPECRHTEARDLSLDLSGVKSVMFEVNQHDLVLSATPGASAKLHGRACASNADWLKDLTLTQQRTGDKLVVKLERKNQVRGISLGSTYAWLDIHGSLPDNILVQLKVGSGDADLSGAHSASADIGSGDVKLSHIKGPVTAAIGSGDLEINGSGPLHVLAIGSGDLVGRDIGGAVKVGNIGSGDLKLDDVRGHFTLGNLGSGEVKVERITGNASVELVGSGDVTLKAVTGNVNIGTVGSGDIRVQDVTGNLTVERTGSGGVDHDNIRGSVQLPRKR